MDFILRNQWTRLALFSALVLIVNFIVVYFFDTDVSRMARWISTFIFLIFLFRVHGKRDHWVLLILLLFLTRDGCIINYELPIYKTMAFLLTNLSYMALILLVLRKIKVKNYNPVILLFTVALVALNGFNLFYLSDVIMQGLDNVLQNMFFFMQGLFLIVLGILAFTYNDRYPGHSPLLFLYFTFTLILSDLSGLAAYFFQWEVAYFPERIFYLLSLTLLVNFSINRNRLEADRISFGV